MNCVGPLGSQMNGRSNQQIWLPRKRFPTSQANRTFRATPMLAVHPEIMGSNRAFPTMPAYATNTAKVSCRNPYSGDEILVPIVSGGVFQTTNSATGLSAPKINDAMANVISTTRNDWRNVVFRPSKGASIPFNSPLPAVVSRMTNGNLIPA